MPPSSPMPYISQTNRAEITPELQNLINWFCEADSIPENVGELNFAISTLLNAMIEKHGISYSNINALIGSLDCIKLELYRRIAVPYEDLKIIQNGDVYGSQ